MDGSENGDQPRQTEKRLFHVDVGLGTGLEEPNSVLVRERLPLFRRDDLGKVAVDSDKFPEKRPHLNRTRCETHLLVRHVAFVSDENFVDALARVLFNVSDPVTNV